MKRRLTRGPDGRGRRERGSAFIEFALLVPVMTLFAMGLVEFGIGWKWANDVNAAVRDAARSGTSEPAYVTADRTVLLAIGTSLTAEQLDNVEQVIVFKSASLDGKVPDTCKNITNTTGNAGTVGARRGTNNGGNIACNVYGKGQIQYVLANPTDDAPWTNSAGNGCDLLDVDWNWCPYGRKRNLVTGSFDYLGVYLKVKKPSTTNFGFGDISVERTAVFQLEPAFGGN